MSILTRSISAFVVCLTYLLFGKAIAITGENYRAATMNELPYFPANTEHLWPDCAPQTDSSDYKTIAESGIHSGWEARVAADWQFFNIEQDLGYITLIDYAIKKDGLAYRYLSNQGSHTKLYEPWSSSKIMAYTGALSKLSMKAVPPETTAGDIRLADLITSIHTYRQSGKANGDSNAISSWLANVATRRWLTGLFHDDWLQMSQTDIRFRGAYGSEVYQPSPNTINNNRLEFPVQLAPHLASVDAPYYQAYRCDSCELNGNKPMTTLAQAEFLKRIVSQKRVTTGAMPHLSNDAVISLLYAPGHDTKNIPMGGMSAGVSRMLHNALASNLGNDTQQSPKQILDKLTDGKWRVFQKIGWGPSETRGQGEVVVLAHVCLPMGAHAKEFTLAARTRVNQATEQAVDEAAQKMELLLTRAFGQMFSY